MGWPDAQEGVVRAVHEGADARLQQRRPRAQEDAGDLAERKGRGMHGDVRIEEPDDLHPPRALRRELELPEERLHARHGVGLDALVPSRMPLHKGVGIAPGEWRRRVAQVDDRSELRVRVDERDNRADEPRRRRVARRHASRAEPFGHFLRHFGSRWPVLGRVQESRISARAREFCCRVVHKVEARYIY